MHVYVPGVFVTLFISPLSRDESVVSNNGTHFSPLVEHSYTRFPNTNSDESKNDVGDESIQDRNN